ncbi:MAG TPA: ABC transporter ATP-binding protein [Methylomirabilota bacterium]|nr:ABC transporter ATP-binding protein [Methylomirabilota bacterium]
MPEPELEDVVGRVFDRRLVARLAQVTRPHARLLAATGLLFPFIAGLELLQPYLLKVAIDEHILRGDWVGLTGVATVFLGVLLALAGGRAAESYLMHLAGQRVMHDLRGRLFRHLLRQEAAFFDRNPVGRLMTRVLNDVEAISEAFTSGLVAVVGDVITLAGVVAVMLWMDWRLALVTFSLMPLLGGGAAYFRVRARDAYRTVRRRLARLNAFLQESLQGMTVIQLFGREAHEFTAFRRLNAELRRAMFTSTVWEASLYASVEALGSAALALLLWYGAGQITAEALSFGTLVAFIQYTNRFFLPIRDLGAKYTVMQAAMASSERVFALLDREPAIVTPPAIPPAARPAAPAVALRGVWFAYTGQDWVLRDCSLEVAPGEHVALVGPTGEGKSTCARLLNRAYDVQQGQVLVAGVDVREWDLERLRRHVGVVFQETVLFSGTVEANLMTVADGRVSRTDLLRILEAARCGPLLEVLPRGLEEELVERGANLSHGQRQLLAIARALVYNPAVLVLDEATSSVDPESEALIRHAIAGLAEGRTTITIAHRLSTAQRADRILVLHHGRIHEEGRHAELLARGGVYARLWELSTSARPA